MKRINEKNEQCVGNEVGVRRMLENLGSAEAFKKLETVMRDIKSLKIQGATNVAIFGVRAFAEYISTIPDSHDDLEVWNHIEVLKNRMFTLRVTEPALKNGIRFVISKLKTKSDFGAATVAAETYIRALKRSKEVIAKIGAARVEDNSTIFTHCHSSVASKILITAFEMGKNFDVVVTETRPVYQGRITVKELLDVGIKVKHVVDSAMRWAMNKFEVDLILLGADAISVEGMAINKIGSHLVALAAREEHIPLYVASSLLKFDEETKIGKMTQIEMRDPSEIWEEAPENLEIYNPAFEGIRRDDIAAYITEKGVIPPQMIYLEFQKYFEALKQHSTN